MSSTSTCATESVNRWLSLEVGDPERSEAIGAVESLGRDIQQRASTAVSRLSIPLAEVSEHCDDGGAIGDALADLGAQLRSLDPAELDTERGLLARVIGKVPGVGSPLGRYLLRFDSSRPRMTSTLESLNAGRDVLARDNVTLRADQADLHELTDSVAEAAAEAQTFDDALVFAIDVELPFGDPRRPLFEDELLVIARQRISDLESTVVAIERARRVIDSVMSDNRRLIRCIDRAREATLGVMAAASTAGASDAAARVALRSAHNEATDAAREAEQLLHEALPDVERTVRDVTFEI